MVNIVNDWLTFRRTTILSVSFLSFLAGLGLARRGIVAPVWLIAINCIAVAACIRLSGRRTATLMMCLLLGLMLGTYRGHGFKEQISPYKQLYGKEVTVRVQASTDGMYANGGQLDFDGSKVKFVSPESIGLPGTIKLQGFGATAVYRGDMVEVRGKLYPTGGSRQGRISFGEIRVLSRSTSWAESVRLKFQAGMQTALPEPQASFGLGLLIGQRATLPKEVTEQLSIVGLTHIIAVSGYNLTIIVRGARRKLGKRSKYQSTIISLVLIVGFLLMTGFSASIVRASIVSVLSLLAWYYGRTFKPHLIISLAAAGTAARYPVYLWSDIGWWLSFLAFFGILIVAPALSKRIFKSKKPKFLAQIVIESLSAQLMTAPLIMYIFSQTSLIALVSNVLIVPLVPWAMLLSAIAGVGGMLMPAIGGWFGWPASILMRYMLQLVSVLAQVPRAQIKQSLSLTGMLVFYAIILFLTITMIKKISARYGKITDENILG